MPRVYKRTALKDYPESGIQRGDVYYWWKRYQSPAQRQLSYPRRSQLTNSVFLQTVYDLEDKAWGNTFEELQSQVDDAISDLQDLLYDTQDSLSVIEDTFPNSSSRELVEERVEKLEEWIGALEGIDIPDEEEFLAENDPEIDLGPIEDYDSDEWEEAHSEWCLGKLAEEIEDLHSQLKDSSPGF